jgi:hypothetical protein
VGARSAFRGHLVRAALACLVVGRVAIIADEKWADEIVRITDIYKGANVRQFAPEKRALAFDWARRD